MQRTFAAEELRLAERAIKKKMTLKDDLLYDSASSAIPPGDTKRKQPGVAGSGETMHAVPPPLPPQPPPPPGGTGGSS